MNLSFPEPDEGRTRSHRGLTLIMSVLLAAIALLAASAPPASAAPVDRLQVSADVRQVDLPALDCATARFTLLLHNPTGQAVYGDAWLSIDGPVRLSRKLVSSYLPPGFTLTAPITLTVPYGTTPGSWPITLTAGRDTDQVTVDVVPPPDNGNVALSATPSMSSIHGRFSPCGTNDGDTDSAHWATFTGWNDATSRTWPDWVTYQLVEPAEIDRVVLHTLDSAAEPASRYGLSDWDVQVWQDGAWVTVAEVRGNRQGVVTSTFAAVTTKAVRILCWGNNNGDYSRIIEVEIYDSSVP